MSDNTYKLEFRDDQIDTMLECLRYLSGEFADVAVGRVAMLACRIAKSRIDEIIKYVEETTR